MRAIAKDVLRACVFSLASIAVSAQTTQDGVPGSLSLAAAHVLSPKVEVEAVRILDQPGGASPKIAVLTGRKKYGWQIVVLSSTQDEHYEFFWKTKRLDSSFDVSQGGALQTLSLGKEKVVAFQGCQAHMCPEVFSALIFVPSLKQSFTATCHDGKTDYSFDDKPETESVRNALHHLLLQQPGSDTACAK